MRPSLVIREGHDKKGFRAVPQAAISALHVTTSMKALLEERKSWESGMFEVRTGVSGILYCCERNQAALCRAAGILLCGLNAAARCGLNTGLPGMATRLNDPATK